MTTPDPLLPTSEPQFSVGALVMGIVIFAAFGLATTVACGVFQ